MRKAVILGERRAGVVAVPDPRPLDDWVLVRVTSAPMCTEYKAFLSGKPAEYLGHEAAGEVVQVARPGRVAVGDRVVVMPQTPCGTCALCVSGDYIHCQRTLNFEKVHGCREGSATMAQFLLKPDWLLPLIPPGVSDDHAAMACCGLGPTFGAFERMGLGAFDTVLITGLGPVGLGGVVNARYRGTRVIGVESHPWRAERARVLGAEAVLDPGDPGTLGRILEATGSRGVDAALDCSGRVEAHRLCIDAARRKGHVAFVGECTDDTPIRVSPDLIRKGLTLVGSWHYNLKDFPKLIQIIQSNGAVLDRLISHTFPLDRIQQAWETQVSGECAKVVLKPWG